MQTSPSQLSRPEFLLRFGALYEHSPWIADRVFDRGLDHRHDDPDVLHEAFRWVIMRAGRAAQLELLRAHPPLAAGLPGVLTGASRREQSGAGLDACSEEELAEFQTLNADYRQRFGFPFIIAVKGLDRRQILDRFRARIAHDADSEFAEALEQVCLIGRYRLDGAVDG